INLSTDYQSGSGRSGPPKAKPNEGPATQAPAGEEKKPDFWRDTDLEIKGPVVAQLQKLFLDHWAEQKGPPLEDAKFFPTVPSGGTEVVRIIGSTPKKWVPRYYVTLLSAIRAAEKSILLSAAYF